MWIVVTVALGWAGEPTIEGSAVESEEVVAGRPRPGSPHFDLEELFAAREYVTGLTRVNIRLRTTPEDVVLYWMKARFLAGVAGAQGGEPGFDAERAYRDIVDTASRGLRLSANDPHLLWQRGLALAELHRLRDRSAGSARQVRSDFTRVLATDGFQYSSLDGRVRLPCDVYAALGTLLRVGAGGRREPLKKSEERHQQAVACNPAHPGVWKELAATQLCIATLEEDEALGKVAMATVARGLAVEPRHDDERQDLKDLAMLRSSPAAACDYRAPGPGDAAD